MFSVHLSMLFPCAWSEFVPQDIPVSFLYPAHLSLPKFRYSSQKLGGRGRNRGMGRNFLPVEIGESTAHMSGYSFKGRRSSLAWCLAARLCSPAILWPEASRGFNHCASLLGSVVVMTGVSGWSWMT